MAMVSFNRMAVLAAEAAEEQAASASEEPSMFKRLSQRLGAIQLPGFTNNSRSLFIFSEDNFIRKYAKLIIEWGYPFLAKLLLNLKFSIVNVELKLPKCVNIMFIRELVILGNVLFQCRINAFHVTTLFDFVRRYFQVSVH